jgi:transposase InsO family protein
VIERPVDPLQEKTWPGQIFEDEQLEYSEAMLAFVEASQANPGPPDSGPPPEAKREADLSAQKRALRAEEAQLRAQRRKIRQKRHHEDDTWRAMKQLYHTMRAPQDSATSEDNQFVKNAQQALRQHRKRICAQRRAEDRLWRQQRQSLRTRWTELPVVTAWIAILVITDNCSRQCPGLPLFAAGPRVTAAAIVDALDALLPQELRFLITDRGSHFRAKVFQDLAQQHQFVHVMIARHRPQSNGIAERFVRTLKEWLFDTSWNDGKDLTALLKQFLVEYNERPHQGLPIPGLSPNEFANRLWLY